MLTSLRLKDWKSFGDGAAMPFGRVTLLVGPNGSGKSNLLDALKFLQGAALDLPLGEVLRGRYEGQREVWPGIRGAVMEAARHGTSTFEIQSAWRVAYARAGDYTHELSVWVDSDAGVARETLLAESDTVFASDIAVDAHRHLGGALNTLVPAADPQLRILPGNRMLLGQVLRTIPGDHDDAAACRVTFIEMTSLIFLEVFPSWMRDYRPVGATQIGLNAENVSPMLYQLSQRDPAQLANVVDWLSELSVPAIEMIDFDRTRLAEVMMFLVEKGGGKISARVASDGTLRFLGLIVALLTIPEGSIIILEEPDVGLHPSRIHLLASLLEDTAKRRSLQVIATTHSPTLLAHLSDQALADVLVFGRKPDDGTTIGRRLGDLPHFATLRDADHLDHLVSTGWLERAL